ncbi:uncharacterized protein NPIL_106641 [Nephila pilipes]|uniref:Uncharacterized protein n=1 Tax=Nephila pilipes TaxID=299642 RepID=A0A8X6PW20_NEPPI|nr:uncharacterized protein NPIL_106641 [Nephila pilipes]
MEDETEEEEEEVTSEEVCECKNFESIPHQMLGRRKERMNEYVGFYDSVFENPDWWRCDDPVEFTEASGLGKDVYGILQRFTRGDLVWFHLMVKHDAFEAFCKDMGKIRGQFALLPFWCLCDGMVSGTGRTQHRHMIVACELESAFKDIWQYKIRYDFPNSGRAKKCVKIQDAFHLARAIVYVSQRKAGCDGRIPTDLTEAGQLSHFHMNRPFHEHSIAFLCTLFPGWIQLLLLQQNRNKDVVRWESESVCVRDQWFHKKWGGGDPCHGMEVYKLRDSLGSTITADRRAHCSVFDITWRSKTVFEKGKCGTGRELVVSTHPGRNLCVIPQTTKCHESNQGDENGTRSCLEMQSGRRKCRNRRVEDGKRRVENGKTRVENGKRHVENQRNRVENGKRRDQNGTGGGFTSTSFPFTAEIPELYFGKSVEESPERSLAETVAQSLEPCSTEPRAASPRPGPSMTKPTVVQRETDSPRRKRSRSDEAKKSFKRSRTDERKSSERLTSPDARPHDPRSQEARPHDPRSQEVRPHETRSQKARPHDPKSQEVRPQEPRSSEAQPIDPRSQEASPHEPRSPKVRPHDPRSPEARPRDFKIPTRHIPAFGRRFLPSSWEEARPQIFFHHHGMAVFSCRDDGFTLTNGVVSYASNQWCVKTLSKCLTYIHIGTVCVTDARSKV